MFGLHFRFFSVPECGDWKETPTLDCFSFSIYSLLIQVEFHAIKPITQHHLSKSLELKHSPTGSQRLINANREGWRWYSIKHEPRVWQLNLYRNCIFAHKYNITNSHADVAGSGNQSETKYDNKWVFGSGFYSRNSSLYSFRKNCYDGKTLWNFNLPTKAYITELTENGITKKIRLQCIKTKLC